MGVYRTQIYRNDNGTLNKDTGQDIIGVWQGSVAWGDYDTDGHMDLAVMGEDNDGNKVLKIYKNNAGVMEEDTVQILGGMYRGELAWADFDNDGSLDLAVTGTDGSVMKTMILKNEGHRIRTNSAPDKPENLRHSIVKRQVYLMWDHASDTGDMPTPYEGMYYAVCVGTAPYGHSIISGRYGSPLMGNYLRPRLSTGEPGIRLSGQRLTDGTSYYWNVKAIDAGLMESGWNVTEGVFYYKDTIAPAAVSTLEGETGDSEGEIRLYWLAPGDDGTEFNLTGEYHIQYATYTLAEWSIEYSQVTMPVEDVEPYTGQMKQVTGLTGGVTYYFRLWTKDSAGNLSGISNGATVMAQWDVTPPSAVTTLAGYPGDREGEVLLMWHAPGDDGMEGILTGAFRIEYATYVKTWDVDNAQVRISTSNVLPGSLRSTLVDNLKGGTSYYMVLWTADERWNWSEVSNQVWVMASPDVDAPAAVTDLAGTASGYEGELRLTWTSPGDDGTVGNLTGRYYIQYATHGYVEWDHRDAQVEIPVYNEEPYTAKVYDMYDLTGGATYYVRLWSEDESGNVSGISNGCTTYVYPDIYPPSAISTLDAQTGTNEGMIALQWISPGDDGTRGNLTGMFRIQYSTYSVDWSTVGAQIEIQVTNLMPLGVQGYVAQELEHGATYYFRIWTCDNAGNWSGISNGATAWSRTDDMAPSAVTTLAARTGDKSGQVNLEWNAPGDDGMEWNLTGEFWIAYSSYVVTWDRTSAQVRITVTNAVPGSIQKITVGGLRPGVEYTFVLWSRDNVYNWSEISNEASANAKLIEDDIRPNEPDGVQAVRMGKNGIKIIWRKVTRNEDGSVCNDISKYRVYRAYKYEDLFTAEETDAIGIIYGDMEDMEYIDEEADMDGNSRIYYRVDVVDEQDNVSRANRNVSTTVVVVSGEEIDFMIVAEDQKTHVYVPGELASGLHRTGKTRKVAQKGMIGIRIVYDEEASREEGVVSGYTVRAYDMDSGKTIDRFTFDNNRAEVNIVYKVESGRVSGTGISVDDAEKYLGMFWHNGVEWVRLGGRVNGKDRTVSICTSRVGRYKVKEVSAVTTLTLFKVYPRVITPNGDGWNDEAYFEYANPKRHSVVMRIYDIRGRVKRMLEVGGNESSFAWDGKDENGDVVPSGIYIYQIEGKGEVINGTIVVAR